MKRISYAETVFGTDDRLADLVLEYARLLAQGAGSDTVTIPGRIGTGDVEPISLLLGPASQITAWGDDEDFEADVEPAVTDLQHRIRGLTTFIEATAEDPGPSVDEFEDLA